MRKAAVFVNRVFAATFTEVSKKEYVLEYDASYSGNPISLKLPIAERKFTFSQFPTYFDGVLPEGAMLEHMLKTLKIDRHDYFSQLMSVGKDLVGHVTVEEIQS